MRKNLITSKILGAGLAGGNNLALNSWRWTIVCTAQWVAGHVEMHPDSQSTKFILAILEKFEGFQ
jgi:hypothetical protein